MGEATVADLSDLDVGKESRHGKAGKELVDQAGIVIGAAEESASTTMTGAEKRGEGRGPHPHLLIEEQAPEFIGGHAGIAELVLQGLANAGHGVDGHGTAFGIGTDDVADEEVAPFVLFQILAYGDAGKEMAAGLFALGIAQFLVDVAQDFIGGTRTEGEQDVAIGLGDGEGFANRFTALGDDGVDSDLTLEREGDASGDDAVIAKDPGIGIAGKATGIAAKNRDVGIGLVPLLEPGFDGDGEGIGEDEPGFDVGGLEPGFVPPIFGGGAGLDVVLSKPEGGDLAAGRRDEHEGKAGAFFLFLREADESGAGATDERGDVAVDADEFEEFLGFFRVIGRGEDDAEGGLVVEFAAELGGELANGRLVKGAGDQSRCCECRHI